MSEKSLFVQLLADGTIYLVRHNIIVRLVFKPFERVKPIFCQKYQSLTLVWKILKNIGLMQPSVVLSELMQ